MHPARLIVFEKTGQHAAAVRRANGGDGQRVYEVRGWSECVRELTASPHSLLVVEAAAGQGDLAVRRLVELRRLFPHSIAIVAAGPELTEWEWLFREAGAVEVVLAAAQWPAAIRIALRHLAAAPQPEMTAREAIWSRLPWRNVASTAPVHRESMQTQST